MKIRDLLFAAMFPLVIIIAMVFNIAQNPQQILLLTNPIFAIIFMFLLIASFCIGLIIPLGVVSTNFKDNLMN